MSSITSTHANTRITFAAKAGYWLTAATAVAALTMSTGALAQHSGGRGGGHSAHSGAHGFSHGGYHGRGYGHGYRGRGWGWGGVGLGLGIGLGYGLGSYYNSPYYYPYAPYPGYVVVDPPVVYGAVQAVPQVGDSNYQQPPAPVIYPRNGQSASQMDSDSDQCSEWAGKQPNATADSNVFRRGITACMDARGYTLR